MQKRNEVPQGFDAVINEKPKTYKCFDGLIGCRGIFTKERFRFSHHEMVAFERESTLCRDCENNIGREYGVNPYDAGAVGTALLSKDFYFRNLEGADEMPNRDKVRALLLACGVKPINPSMGDIAAAALLRKTFPIFGTHKVDALVKSVPSVSDSVLPVGDRA
jgi:hypothetical protein